MAAFRERYFKRILREELGRIEGRELGAHLVRSREVQGGSGRFTGLLEEF